MTNKELASALRNNMFAQRETLDEAFEYVDVIAKASNNPAAVWTAVQVVINTIAKTIEENESRDLA
jgi:hypothetical protein